MTSFVGEALAREAAVRGDLVGRTQPSGETKGTHWQVYYDGTQLTACVVADPWGITCGERIIEKELGKYCDDENEARRIMTELTSNKPARAGERQ